MIISGGGGGNGDRFVGIAPAGATALVGQLASAGADLERHSRTVMRLLAEAGATSVSAPFLLDGIGSWATAAAADLRWRVDAIVADQYAIDINGMRYDELSFDSAADANAAGWRAGERVLAMIDHPFRMGSEDDAQQFLDELHRRLMVVGAQDPAFAAAFFNALGADGMTFLLRVVDEAGGQILRDWETGPQILQPFDELFAAATRARRADGSWVLDAKITDALLRSPDTLEMLFWYGNNTRDAYFTAYMAAQVLGPDTARLVAPWTSLTHIPYPDGEESLRWTMLRALDASPEASFDFVVTLGHGDLLTFHDGDAYGNIDTLAGAILGKGFTFATSDSDKAKAEDAFCRLATQVAHGDARLSDESRRVFAELMQPRMNEIAERALRGPGTVGDDHGHPHAIAMTYDDLEKFIGNVLKDERARGTFLAGAAHYTATQTQFGMQAIADAGGDPLTHTVLFQGSASRIGSLYGMTEKALFDAGLKAKEAASLLVGTLKAAGDLAITLGLGAAPLSDGTSAVAGAGAKWLLDQGAKALDGALTNDVGRNAQAVGTVVEQELARTMAATIYNNADLRARLHVGTPPARFLDGNGNLVPPAPGSADSDEFLGWIASQPELESLALNTANEGFPAYILPLVDALRDKDLHG